MSDHPVKWEILPGLPPYGPLAEAFSATGRGTHQEGFVVRFKLSEGDGWVGNFQRGSGAAEGVWPHPNPDYLVVVAGGTGYVIDPVERVVEGHFGECISAVLAVPEIDGLVLTQGLWFEAIGAEGLLWRSRRVSWDGVRSLRRSQTTLRGEAYDPMTDEWLVFELDLVTGEAVGGSYWGPAGASLWPNRPANKALIARAVEILAAIRRALAL